MNFVQSPIHHQKPSALRMGAELEKTRTNPLGSQERAEIQKLQEEAQNALKTITAIPDQGLQRQKLLMLSQQILSKVHAYIEKLPAEKREKLINNEQYLKQLTAKTQEIVDKISEIPLEAAGTNAPGKRYQSPFEKKLLNDLIMDLIHPDPEMAASARQTLMDLKVDPAKISTMEAQLREQYGPFKTVRFGMGFISMDALIEEIGANNSPQQTINAVIARNTANIINKVTPLLFGEWVNQCTETIYGSGIRTCEWVNI